MNKDINKEIEMDSDTEIYLINKLEMEKLCRAKEPATISISDPRLQVGWVNFRSRGENDGNIEMVLAIYNKEKFQDLLTKQVEEYANDYEHYIGSMVSLVEKLFDSITAGTTVGWYGDKKPAQANLGWIRGKVRNARKEFRKWQREHTTKHRQYLTNLRKEQRVGGAL